MMAAPKQTDPQFKLRLTPEIKGMIEAVAKMNNRSMNAEILARLTEHPRIALLEKRLMAAEHERDALKEKLDVAKSHNEYLTGVITDAALRENKQAESQGLGSMLEALSAQIADLTEERSAIDRDRDAMLERMQETIRVSGEEQTRLLNVLMRFGMAIDDAAKGDEDKLRRMIDAYREAPSMAQENDKETERSETEKRGT